MVAGGAKPSLWILLLLGIAADLPPAEAQETPCAEDDDKQAHRDFPNIGASSCAGILAAGQCSQVAGHGVCDCSCPLAAVEPAAEPAGPQPQPPTACASGQPASGSLLPDDTACCDVPGWTDDAGNNCSAYIAQGWCCTAGVNEGCNSQYALPGGVDSDHGCCRSCAEYVPPEPEPALPAPDGCVDDDAAMQAATAGQGDFTCAGIIVAGACSQVASLGICTCSCPMTSPPPTTCASGQPSSGSLLAVDATCCDVPGWVDDAGNTCDVYVRQGWCCTDGLNNGCNAAYRVPGGVGSDYGCCRACALQCIDDNALLVERLLDIGFDFATDHPNQVDGACSYLTTYQYGPAWHDPQTAEDFCEHWSGEDGDLVAHFRATDPVGTQADHIILDFRDRCACACYDVAAHDHDGPGDYVLPGTCDDGVRNGNETLADCGEDCGIACVPGCTEPAATNFNGKAVHDDGSCTFDFVPCTDSVADTYDSRATLDYFNPSVGPPCLYTCAAIVAAVSATPCPASDSSLYNASEPARYALDLRSDPQEEWKTPCSATPAMETLLRLPPTCFINDPEGFRAALGEREFFPVVAVPTQTWGDEYAYAAYTTQSLWVVSVNDNATLPEMWGNIDPSIRTIRVMNQTAVILYGTPSRPVFNARWRVDDESFLAVHHLTFRDYSTRHENVGEGGSGAAIFAAVGPVGRTRGPVIQLVSCVFANLRAADPITGTGGAIHVETSFIYIDGCEFTRCFSQLGGAIYASADDYIPNRLVVKDTAFRNNKARDVAGTVSKGSGGAFYLQNADLMLFGATFVNNSAQGDTAGQLLSGDNMVVTTAPRFVTVGTTSEPFDALNSYRLYGSNLYPCDEWPCRPGQDCAQHQQSLICTLCPADRYSDDGLRCKVCPAGHEPSADRTQCIRCTGNAYSHFGVCLQCPTNRVPRLPDRQECIECPDRQYPGDGTGGTDNSTCYCASGFYNATELGLYICFGLDGFSDNWRSKQVEAADKTVRTLTLDQSHEVQHCQRCSEDRRQSPPQPCALCSGANLEPPQTRPGYVIPTEPGYSPTSGGVVLTPFNRSIVTLSSTVMFACGAPHAKPKDHCPGSYVTVGLAAGRNGCAPGYAGVFCQNCVPNFYLSNQLCKSCEGLKTSSSAWVASGMMVTFVVWLGVVCLRSRNDTVELARGSAASSPGNQLGASLFNSFDASHIDRSVSPDAFSGGFGLGVELDQDLNRSGSVWKGMIVWFPKLTTLNMVMRASFQPLRIVITYIQVTCQLGLVLDIEFPPMFTALLDLLRPFIDVFKFISFYNLECWDQYSYGIKWIVKIAITPSVCFMVAGLYYLYEQKKQRPTARMHLKSNIFFAIFFVYPTVCNTAFEAFSTKQINYSQNVLIADDRIFSEDPEEIVRFAASIFVTTFWSVGVPIAFGGYLMYTTNDYDKSRTETELAGRVAAQFNLSPEVAAYIIREIHIGKDFSFLMDAYKPRCYYWETLDLLRKLALVGLVVIAGRGSAAQVMVGATFSFAFFSLHMRAWPYKIDHDNNFRAATETHTFLTMLVAFLLRLDDHQGLEDEVIGLPSYDWMLVVSFVTLVPGAFVWTIVSKLKFVSEVQNETWAGSKSDFAAKRAIDRHILGLADEEDIKVLEKVFDRLRIKVTTSAFTKVLEGRNWVEENQDQNDGSPTADDSESTYVVPVSRQRVRAGGNGRVASTGMAAAAAAAAEKHERSNTSDTFYGKFSAGFIGSFADMSDFYGGLEDMIGECRKDLMRAMTEEHTAVQSGFGASHESFTTSNYMVSTTPRDEWLFVVDPESVPDMDAGTDPATKKSRGTRQRLNIDDLYDNAADLITKVFSQNKLFWQVTVTAEDLKEVKLLRVEVIALRLYTGPLFELYNTVLRAWGNTEDRGVVPSYSGVFKGMDVRGCFTTTIHVINSGVLKLSRLQPAVPVYRGISGMKLPKRFIEADEYNVRGGVEYAFMSTTTDESVALGYAKGGDRDTATTLIEASMGMVDRGASLDWLSQYPHEREILLPPLTAMEVISITDYESADSIDALDSAGFLVRRLNIRLNCNLVSSTIEKLLSVRKKQVEELTLVVEKDIETQKKHIDAADIDRRYDRLIDVKNKVEKQAPAEFNDNVFLIDKMEQVLGLLPKLGDQIEVLSGHSMEVYGLAATHDGSDGFASSSWDGSVVIWGLNDRNQFVRFDSIPLKGQSLCLMLAEGSPVRELSGRPILRLASGMFDGSIAIRELEAPGGLTVDPPPITSLITAQNERRHTRSPITALAPLSRARPGGALSPFPPLLASGAMDGEISLWDTANDLELFVVAGVRNSQTQSAGQQTQMAGGTVVTESPLSSNDLFQGNASFATRTGSMYGSIDSNSGGTMIGHVKAVRSLLWVLVQGDAKLISSSFDHHVIVWGVSVGDSGVTLVHQSHLVDHSCDDSAAEMTAHRGAITAMARVDLPRADQSALLATASEDSTIKLWTLGSQPEVIRTLHSPAGSSGVCSLTWMPLPNGKDGPAGWLASGHGNHTIVVHKVFDKPNESVELDDDVATVTLRGHSAAVHTLLWLPDRGWLVSGSADSTIRTWRMRTINE